MSKGREKYAQKNATTTRNPGDVLNQGKKKKNGEPVMLGPPIMSITIEGSRFKSSFGKLEPTTRRLNNPKALPQPQQKRN